MLWTVFSNKDSVNPLDDSSSLYKASRPYVGAICVLPQREPISIERREYLSMSHISIEWLILADPNTFSCLLGKYILERVRDKGSRFGYIFPNFCRGKPLRFSVLPAAFAEDCRRAKPCWRRRILVSLHSISAAQKPYDEQTPKLVGCFGTFWNSPGNAGRTEFASRRHTGQRNSPWKWTICKRWNM